MEAALAAQVEEMKRFRASVRDQLRGIDGEYRPSRTRPRGGKLCTTIVQPIAPSAAAAAAKTRRGVGGRVERRLLSYLYYMYTLSANEAAATCTEVIHARL